MGSRGDGGLRRGLLGLAHAMRNTDAADAPSSTVMTVTLTASEWTVLAVLIWTVLEGGAGYYEARASRFRRGGGGGWDGRGPAGVGEGN